MDNQLPPVPPEQAPQLPPPQVPETIQVVNTPSGVNLSVKTIVISVLVLLGVGAAVGRYATPDKVVTKVVTKTETQIVYKEVENKNVENHKNTVTTITHTTAPDGSKTDVTVITNKDDIKVVDNKTINSDTKTQTETTSTKTVTNEKRQWIVQALFSPSHPSNNILGGTMSYGASVEKQIIGPFYGGAFGLTNQTYGLSLGVTF